ncbi:MAG TPA: VanZ family protein [Anaerolineae bacterium]|nr:VanZ family protein [Anaerolineae bacterium]
MSIYSSDRERRLWIWTLIVVAAIYSTLGLTATLAETLLESGMFTNAFITAFLLMLTAVLTQGLKVRPRGIELGVGIGIAAVYIMVFARMGIVERTHLFEYSIVATLIYEALKERASQGRIVRAPGLVAILVTSLIGALDEGIQFLLPSRVFDPIDMGFNALAGFMAVIANVALTWARTWWAGKGKA